MFNKRISQVGMIEGKYQEKGSLSTFESKMASTADYSLYNNPDYGNDTADGAGTAIIKGNVLTCGTASSSTYTVWAAVTDGSFGTVIDGVYYNITAIDFSAVASMNDVASTLQTAIRAATSGTETVVWSTDHFVITVTTNISVLTTARSSVGTDISGNVETALWVNGLNGGLTALNCGAASSAVFGVWAAVTNGSFAAIIDGTYREITSIDFTGDASMNDVAATLQTAIRAVTSGTETVVWSTDKFIITAATSMSLLSSVSNVATGTDISGEGSTAWMNGSKGALATWASIYEKISPVSNYLVYIVCSASINYDDIPDTKGLGVGELQIYGDPTTPANCKISHTGTGSAWNIYNSTVEISLWGFTLDGDGNASSIGIYADKAQNVYLNNVVIKDFGKNISLTDSNNFVYEECDISNATTDGLYAVNSTFVEINCECTTTNTTGYELIRTVGKRYGLDPLTPGITGTTFRTMDDTSRIYDDSGIEWGNGWKKEFVVGALADDGTVALTAANGLGKVIVGDMEEYAYFEIKNDGTVHLTVNSANVVSSDTDTKFCIFDAGSVANIRNRLGSSKNVLREIIYYI